MSIRTDLNMILKALCSVKTESKEAREELFSAFDRVSEAAECQPYAVPQQWSFTPTDYANWDELMKLRNTGFPSIT